MINYDLIVTIVNRGYAEEVIDAAKSAGAEGGTIMTGRGQGVHDKAKILGVLIEPEKDIVLTIINRNKTKDVLQSICQRVKLNEPSKGVAFVLEIEKAAGICHQEIEEHIDGER